MARLRLKMKKREGFGNEINGKGKDRRTVEKIKRGKTGNRNDRTEKGEERAAHSDERRKRESGNSIKTSEKLAGTKGGEQEGKIQRSIGKSRTERDWKFKK